MADRVSLDNVSPDQFEQLAQLLAESISQRQITMRMWVPSLVQLQFDSMWMTEALGQRDLPVEACLSQLRIDMPIMLAASLLGRTDTMSRHLASDTELTESDYLPDDAEEVIRLELLARCELLEQEIITDGVRNRFAVKVTAKANILAAAEWEVVQRHSDSTLGPITGLKYANLSLFVQRPSRNEISIAPESETLTVTLTEEDIIDLQSSLEAALTALQDVESGEVSN